MQGTEQAHNEDPDNRLEVIKRIKEYPANERVHLIALNHYLEQKKNQDKELEAETDKLQNLYDLKCIPYYQAQNEFALGEKAINEEVQKTIESFLLDEELSQYQQYQNDVLPDYWFKIVKQFYSTDANKGLVSDQDMEILKFLLKIELELYEGKNDFKLIFTFSQNEYFDNTVLSKHFIYSDDKQKAEYPIKSIGTQINWKDESKNVTVKQVSKKQKNKKTGATRVIKKLVKADSFFNLFRSVESIKDDDESQEQMDQDFDIAREFVETILPNQLELYLGIDNRDKYEDFEDMGDEIDEDEDDDDDDNNDVEDDDDDDDEDDKKKNKDKKVILLKYIQIKQKYMKPHKKSGDLKGEPKGQKQECKQQ